MTGDVKKHFSCPLSFIMIQDIPYPFFFCPGNLPFVVAEVVFLVIRGIIGIIEILIPFVAAVVIAVSIVKLPDAFHSLHFLSFAINRTAPCKQVGLVLLLVIS